MTAKKLTTFYVVRHGETDWNAQNIVQGNADIPLNKIGEKQAKELAEKLQNIKFDLAFSSDLLRAKQTAEIIVLEHKLAVKTTKLLRERDFGKFQGNPSKVLFTHNQLLKKLIGEKRFKHKMAEDIESDEQLISRVLTFFRETAFSYPSKIILVGAHGGILRHLLIHLGELTYEESDKLTVSNGAYLRLESDGIDFFVKEKVGIKPRENLPEFV